MIGHHNDRDNNNCNENIGAGGSGDDSLCIEGELPPDSLMLGGEAGGGRGGGGIGVDAENRSCSRFGNSKKVTFNVFKKVSTPSVAGEKISLRNSDSSIKLEMDVVVRDPRQMNEHCRVKFEDIIAEPDPTVFSFDGVWTLSYKVFTSTKLWCYRITSLICAIPAAICWGIEFACLSFCTIWCWQPSLKAYEISLWYTRRLFEIFLTVFFEPCFHAMGKCLSHIVVTVKREG